MLAGASSCSRLAREISVLASSSRLRSWRDGGGSCLNGSVARELDNQKLLRLVEGRARNMSTSVLHSTLAYVSPMRFENNWFAAQVGQANA